MKEIPVFGGKTAFVDDDDFEKASGFKWHLTKKGYVHSSRGVYLHVLIMKQIGIDHKDLNKLNNQKSNLRVATNSQNHGNKPPQKNNKTGFKGVCWNKENHKYCANIHVNGKHINLGRFESKEEAARAYNEAAVKNFGEFARINPIL